MLDGTGKRFDPVTERGDPVNRDFLFGLCRKLLVVFAAEDDLRTADGYRVQNKLDFARRRFFGQFDQFPVYRSGRLLIDAFVVRSYEL